MWHLHRMRVVFPNNNKTTHTHFPHIAMSMHGYPSRRRSTRGAVPNYSIYADGSDDDFDGDGSYSDAGGDDDDTDGTYNYPGSTTRLLSQHFQQSGAHPHHQQQQAHYQQQQQQQSAASEKRSRFDWVKENSDVPVQRWGRQLCQVGNYKVERWERRVIDGKWWWWWCTIVCFNVIRTVTVLNT